MEKTPRVIAAILNSPVTDIAARVLLTFPFWGSGLSKLIDFQTGVGEMAHFGLEPAVAYNIATIITQLGGSLLIILGRWTWLGAGALGVFTALTIPLAHHFWDMPGEEGISHFHTATEHVGVIGGLIVASILAARKRA